MRNHPAPKLETIANAFHQIDLRPLENRLVGKSLIELEHCLTECLGDLFEQHRNYNKYISEDIEACKLAGNKHDFFDAHRLYLNLKSEFRGKYNIGSPIGQYFYHFKKKIQAKEEKANDKIKGDQLVPNQLCFARMLAAMIEQKIDAMWASSSSNNKEIDTLWNYWIERR